MRIGFIGAGGIARNYLGSLDKIDSVTVSAICDVNAATAEAAAQPREAQVYTDHQAMLSEATLDVVFICIPPGAHQTQVIDAAQAVDAVFVAKPVAVDLETALRTRDAIIEAGVINQVGYMARYSDITEKARELVGDQALCMGFGRFLCRMGPGHPWWGKKAISGGQMLEQSTHVFDLIRYFLGDVAEVSAYGQGDIYFADFEECTTCNLKFTSGAVGNITSTCVARAPGGFATELIGNDIYLRLEHDAQLRGNIGGEAIDYRGAEAGYYRQVVEFIKAVETANRGMVKSDYADAVKTLAVTLAANKSLETGRIEKVQA